MKQSAQKCRHKMIRITERPSRARHAYITGHAYTDLPPHLFKGCLRQRPGGERTYKAATTMAGTYTMHEQSLAHSGMDRSSDGAHERRSLPRGIPNEESFSLFL